jgi:hypothetical protein
MLIGNQPDSSPNWCQAPVRVVDDANSGEPPPSVNNPIRLTCSFRNQIIDHDSDVRVSSIQHKRASALDLKRELIPPAIPAPPHSHTSRPIDLAARNKPNLLRFQRIQFCRLNKSYSMA